MCDTFVALPDATADGSVIFGKNSDREPNEAHELLLIPRARHAPDASGSIPPVKLTYIEVPQAPETYAVLLARPFWLWGAEMGANEHGVVIGNEAVFTKMPFDKEPGLLGMDMLRLALERAPSASAAVDVITALLAQHGQGGNCGYQRPMAYHNSFIVADPEEAWVLETAGREWAAQRITNGVRSISNALTIGATWDLASPGLVETAVQRGWCPGSEDFHFARCYTDDSLALSTSYLYTRLSDARFRQSCTTRLLGERYGELTVAAAMAVLRDHGPEAGPNWTPARGLTGATVCNHASLGPVRASNQTSGSLVSHLRPGLQTHWLTGTSAPCTSIFKPAWIDAGLPDLGPAPTGAYDGAALWWQHEVLHREVLRDYASRIATYQGDRNDLEECFLQEVQALVGDSAAGEAQRLALSRRCFDQARAATERWAAQVAATAVRQRRSWHHARFWRWANQEAGMPAVG